MTVAETSLISKETKKGYDRFVEEIDDLEYSYNGSSLTSMVEHKIIIAVSGK